jgi:hypothetical protein
MALDGNTADLVVGMVNINCPACGELLTVDVLVESVSTVNGAYLNVAFQKVSPSHRCTGRRT